MPVAVDVEESLAAKFAALFPHLDERQRRLMMGAEARVLGHGGVAAVARSAGVSRVTVSGGVRELEAGEEPLRRTRRPGGGRKSVTETDPGVKAAQPGRRAGRAGPQGVGADRGGAAAGGELQPARNTKTIEGGRHPDRDAQFSHI